MVGKSRPHRPIDVVQPVGRANDEDRSELTANPLELLQKLSEPGPEVVHRTGAGAVLGRPT